MLIAQTLGWYQQHREFLKLSPNSRRNYTYLLELGFSHLSHLTSLNQVNAEVADSLYTDLLEAYGLHRAVSVCRIMCKVWNVMKRRGIVAENPFSQMGLPTPDGRDQLWTLTELNTFIRGCVEIGLPSLGMLANLCHTFAQRPGDMRKLQWGNIQDRWISFVQEKTGKEMLLYIPEQTYEELMLVERIGPYICTREDTYEPYTDRDYNLLTAEVKENTGLPAFLQIRDLRRTALTELAGKLSDDDLMLISGHSNRNTLNFYTVHTQERAKKAMERRF